MLKTILLIALAGTLLNSTSSSAQSPADAQQPQVAASSVPSQDWHKLRFAENRGFTSDEVKKMWDSINRGDFQEGLAHARKAIAIDPADGPAHVGAAYALDQLGDKEAGMKEHHIVKEIAESIMAGRNGRTEETAWVTANVGEEYFLIQVLGLQPKLQSLVTSKDGKAYDEMTVTDREDPGHEYTLWFDATFSMQAMDRAIHGKQK